MMNEIISILRQAEIFHSLTTEQLQVIESFTTVRDYQSREVIFSENDISSELYIIAEGIVEILVDPSLVVGPTSDPPVPSTIATLRRGQCFGEIALVDQGIRSAAARSASPETKLAIIPRSKLMEVCSADPVLGYVVMRNLAADLALKIRSTDLSLREHLLYRPGSDCSRK